METTTENMIKNDPRYRAAGVGANDRIDELLREHLSPAEVTSIHLRRNDLMSGNPWRPSDALRQAVAEHLRGNVYRP